MILNLCSMYLMEKVANRLFYERILKYKLKRGYFGSVENDANNYMKQQLV